MPGESHYPITYRWIEGPQASEFDWQRITRIFDARGWATLYRELARILVAERGDDLLGFIVLRWLPHTEPLWVRPSERGNVVAQGLADRMKAFLDESEAYGYMAVAEHPVAARMCEERGMTRVNFPVYVMGRPQ